MNNATSVIDIFKMYLGHSRDPFLNSIKGLPFDVLDTLLVDLVKRSEIACKDDTLHIAIDIGAFKSRVKGAYKTQVLEDEVGVLIRYGASKNVITEVTGVHQSKIVSKRKVMTSDYPKQGRPKQLDAGEKKLVIDCWHKVSGNKAVRLIRAHHYSGVPINDVWLLVKDIKPNSKYESKQACI